MRQYLFLLALLPTLDCLTAPGINPTCNTIWRYKADVYTQGSTLAHTSQKNIDLQTCMTICSRSYTTCTACESRKGNCWIQQKPITAEKLVHWNGTGQHYLAQRCIPEFCSANWLEVGTPYPEGYPLTDFDKGYRSKCLELCAKSSSDSSSPCARVFFCPTTGGNYEPFGSSCTLEAEGYAPAPSGCIEYKLLDDCM